MKFFARHKLIIILAVILMGLAWWGLSGSEGGSSSSSLLTTQGVDAGANPADQALIATLLQLRAVKLDGTIFNDPAFRALRDYSTQIISEPVGRVNPFAPLSARANATQDSPAAAAIFTPSQ